MVLGRLWVLVVLTGCGRIGFGESTSGLGSNDAGDSANGDGAVGTSYAPVDPPLAGSIADKGSPCTTTSTQMFGSYTGGVSMVNTASGWAVAWSDSHPETYVTRFDSTGTQIGTATKVTTNTGDPTLTWTGSGYGLIAVRGKHQYHRDRQLWRLPAFRRPRRFPAPPRRSSAATGSQPGRAGPDRRVARPDTAPCGGSGTSRRTTSRGCTSAA